MKKLKCKIKGCNKIIEGFSDKHVEWQMMQHLNKHRLDEKHNKEAKQ